MVDALCCTVIILLMLYAQMSVWQSYSLMAVNKSIDWMGDDNKDLSLKTTAALIIANMATTGMLYYGHPYTSCHV